MNSLQLSVSDGSVVLDSTPHLTQTHTHSGAQSADNPYSSKSTITPIKKNIPVKLFCMCRPEIFTIILCKSFSWSLGHVSSLW